eukprot:NODE_3763_length_1165_cov_103.390595_g3578_i0.p1 GENE.NODE_3763_length_1165_cov_103.390595_g3578_i0~~NODE_3763_length_1165_cov_103.390595_g3578_i0.p1  ORF type:complete len:329 (+),score=52.39 NODE_3763_length_1165_cov_103.390595_g3578_i0:98-988(+)
MADLQVWVQNHTLTGTRLAFVPTMGALHDGHISLIETARAHADCVVASIFVNPKQFGKNEDFGRYPRTTESDIAKLREAGCNAIWLPEEADIYPPNFCTRVTITGPLSETLCGQNRPEFFGGVATVVHRLLSVVRPHVLVLGNKDWQQQLVIRRMVQDLLLPVTVVGSATIREQDGLPRSSRNAYLSKEARAAAGMILPPALTAVQQQFQGGAHDGQELQALVLKVLEEGIAKAKAKYVDMEFALHYGVVVNGTNLETPTAPWEPDQIWVCAVAVVVDGTRLLDNIHLSVDTSSTK